MYNPLIDKTPYGAAVAGEQVTIKFTLDCAMGVKRMFVVLRQIFGAGGEVQKPALRFEMPLQAHVGEEDVFFGAFALGEWGIWKYRFEGEFADGSLAFFGRGKDGCAIRGDWLPEWQLTVSKCHYKTPDWAKQGVIYQIFADRFCRVGEKPFEKRGRLHTYWNDLPDIAMPGKDYNADDFFGGNIRGILSRLDYIKSLGVSCIYLSPIFKSCSNHRYDTADYLQIDELFGSEQEFALLIERANELGIKILLDGVFNHTGADSIYFNKCGNYDSLGAYQSKQSPYYDWYTFFNYPDDYYCWWGSTVVPTVNKDAAGFCDLMFAKGGVIDKWTSMGIGGWRLDVVDELPIHFVDRLCKSIKNHGEDKLIVGEVWEDASVKQAYGSWRPYFMGEQLDSVMNYPFKHAILSFATGGSVQDFVGEVTTILENYPKQSLDVLMNLIDSHDTVRAITALSGVQPPPTKRARADFRLSESEYALARNRLMFASTLQYFLPGVPCLFYGDEAGLQGFEDPLNRATYPWGREDKSLVQHYIALGNFRKQYASLLQGESHFEQDDQIVVLSRKSQEGELILFANNTDACVQRSVSGEDALSKETVQGYIKIEPHSCRIIVKNTEFCKIETNQDGAAASFFYCKIYY